MAALNLLFSKYFLYNRLFNLLVSTFRLARPTIFRDSSCFQKDHSLVVKSAYLNMQQGSLDEKLGPSWFEWKGLHEDHI